MIIITTTVWLIGNVVVVKVWRWGMKFQLITIWLVLFFNIILLKMYSCSQVRSISIFTLKKDENYSLNFRNTCSLNIVNKLIVKRKEYTIFIHCCTLLLSLVFFQNQAIDRISSIYPTYMILNALAYTKSNFCLSSIKNHIHTNTVSIKYSVKTAAECLYTVLNRSRSSSKLYTLHTFSKLFISIKRAQTKRINWLKWWTREKRIYNQCFNELCRLPQN